MIAMKPQSKQKPARSKKYLEWIRTMPCSVKGCSASNIAAHHVYTGGMGTKCDDSETIPLCDPFGHHTELHRIGKKSFAEKYGTDFEEVIAKCRNLWIKQGGAMFWKGR